jgi:hypothetical protein
MASTENRTFETVKKTFTENERRRLGETLARTVQQIVDNKQARLSAAADFQAKHKALEMEAIRLTDCVNRGFEEVEVEVMTMYDRPRPGKKQILRVDNNEVVRTEDMTPLELQSSFGFPEPEGGEKAES